MTQKQFHRHFATPGLNLYWIIWKTQSELTPRANVALTPENFSF